MRSLILLLLSMAIFSCQPKVIEKPNIVLILTDDQGYGDIRLHGNDLIRTPSMDQLAATGVRLNNFYVSPVCAPTRASLLTGRYHLRTGTTWVTRNAEMMSPDEVTLAEILRSQGYRTGCFGKWHNGAQYPSDPIGQGFGQFTGFKAGHFTNYFDPLLDHAGGKKKFDGYISDVITDEAIRFIESNKDRPFLCYVPFNAPHAPYEVPDRFFAPYKRADMDDRLAATYGMVENVDFNIGRIMSVLDKNKLKENTIIVFITDNGPQFDRYNAEMKGRKGWVNDGGVRVPCFISWQGKIEPGVSDALTAHIDILPTLLSLTGLDTSIPENIDGVDLSDHIINEATPKNRTLYTHFRYENGQIPKYPGAVRNDSLRLVIDVQGKSLLTSLLDDRMETTDLTARYPEIADNMRLGYDTWITSIMPETGIPPLPIGYQEVSEVYLAAHESVVSDSLTFRFSTNGWAHDWIVNWNSTDDLITWPLAVNQDSEYVLELEYSLSEGQQGSIIEVRTSTDTVQAQISEPFNSQLIPNQDRYPRVVEAYEQTWGRLSLDTISLTKGKDMLSISAISVEADTVANVKGVYLRRLR